MRAAPPMRENPRSRSPTFLGYGLMARGCCSGRVVSCCAMMVFLLCIAPVPRFWRRLVCALLTVVQARLCLAEQQDFHAREYAIFVPVGESLRRTHGTNVDAGTVLYR